MAKNEKIESKTPEELSEFDFDIFGCVECNQGFGTLEEFKAHVCKEKRL